MFKCETCGAERPEDCRCVKNVGMTPINGQSSPVDSLDVMAEEVRECRRAEARAADEANLLRGLADQAKARYHELQDIRERAERRMRNAYNEAVTP